jgi:hypothetical protein
MFAMKLRRAWGILLLVSWGIVVACGDDAGVSGTGEPDAASPDASSDGAGTNDAIADSMPPDAEAGGASSPAAMLSIGGDQGCRVSSQGVVTCWGGGAAAPFAIAPTTTFSTVGVADGRACAVDTSGQLSCWNETGPVARQPYPIPGLTWRQISVGQQHLCGITTSGALYCFGNNGAGQLGVGDTALHPAPTQVGTDTDWLKVSVDLATSCALKTSGALYCWGYDGFGEVGDGLGDGSVGTDQLVLSPKPVMAGTTWRDVGAGACAIRSDGALLCWALSSWPDGGPKPHAPVLVDPGPDWVQLSVASHSCALDTKGAVYCFGGINTDGELGNGGTSPSNTPGQVGTDTDWAEVAVGYGGFSCGRKKSGAVQCWGKGDLGELGVPIDGGSTTPVPTLP